MDSKIRYPYEYREIPSVVKSDGTKIPKKIVLYKYFPETDTLYVLKIVESYQELAAYCKANSIDVNYVQPVQVVI